MRESERKKTRRGNLSSRSSQLSSLPGCMEAAKKMTRWEARTIYGSKQPSSEPGYRKSTSVPKQPAFPACGAMIPPAPERGEPEESRRRKMCSCPVNLLLKEILPCKSFRESAYPPSLFSFSSEASQSFRDFCGFFFSLLDGRAQLEGILLFQ